METKRIFIAVDISEEVRCAIQVYVEKLRSVPDEGIRWEHAQKIHLTLKFIGNHKVSSLEDLKFAVREIAAHHREFDLMVGGTGVFPSSGNARILWVGLSRAETLNCIHEDLENIGEKLGIAKEKRALRPHLTIARVKDQSRAQVIVRRHLASTVGPMNFRVSELVIYESNLLLSGSIHSVVSKHGLIAKTESK